MAENYSLNSGFGFNISSKNPSKIQKAPQEQSKISSLNETVGNLFDSMTSYVAKYEDVFNGDINMYSRQSMIVGMNLKASDKTIHRFDMNI